VDLNANPGVTPLLMASSAGKPEIIDLLLANGANPNTVDPSGTSPLILAAFGGHTETVVSLLKAGADVNARTSDGTTALIEAARKRHADIVELLLMNDANPDSKDANERTALDLTFARLDITALTTVGPEGLDATLDEEAKRIVTMLKKASKQPVSDRLAKHMSDEFEKTIHLFGTKNNTVDGLGEFIDARLVAWTGFEFSPEQQTLARSTIVEALKKRRYSTMIRFSRPDGSMPERAKINIEKLGRLIEQFEQKSQGTPTKKKRPPN
jgi:hypothetical protein